MTIKKITILKQCDGDSIFLHTNLPNPHTTLDRNLSLHFDAVKGTGEEYVKKNFPDVKIEVLEDCR